MHVMIKEEKSQDHSIVFYIGSLMTF